MKLSHWLWGLLILVGVLLLSVATVVVMAIEKGPLVIGQPELTSESIFRAKKLFDENNPQRLKTGETHEVIIEQSDLLVALQYAASPIKGMAVEVALHEQSASVRATVPIPQTPLGQFLNIRAILEDTGRLPRFASLRVGGANLPGFLGDWFLTWSLQKLQGEADGPSYADLLKKMSMTEGRLALTYEWNEGLATQLKSVLVPADEQTRWKAAQEQLSTLLGTLGSKNAVPLTSVLTPMLQFAKESDGGADPVAANRAVVIVLGTYLVGKSLDLLVPDAKSWPIPPRVTITIGGRDDFPKHFMISAAMAASAGSAFSEAVGVYKEVRDSRGGTGFSFNDIAADRAGTRFGEFAIASAEVARRVQKSAAGLKESEFFPEWKDLPEFMPEEEFKSRFGGLGGAEYLKMSDDIDKRVAALSFYR